MTNEYFYLTSETQLARLTLGRASAVNALLSAVEAGFDKIPTPARLNQGRVTYAEAGGVANAYTLALPTTISSYVDGLYVSMKIPTGLGNTGASTLNVDGVGAAPILRPNGEAVEAGDLPENSIVDLTYNGTDFRLPAAVSVAVTGSANITDGSVTTAKLATDAVTAEKLASAALKALAALTPAANRIPYFTAADTAALATVAAYGLSLLAAGSAAAARSTLGATATGEALFTAANQSAGRSALNLGGLSTMNPNAVAFTGGTSSGVTHTDSKLSFGSSELTIATGSVTPTKQNHTIDTQSDAASDDLDTIVVTNLPDEGLVHVRAAHTDRTVVVKDGTGNLHTADGEDYALDDAAKSITFQIRGTDLYEVARSYHSSDTGYRSTQVFTSGGTWNKPAGLRRVRVTVVGGGGGGGQSQVASTGGFGGSAGGASIKTIEAASLGSTETVTIGSGGAGGSAGAGTAVGSNGGPSSFGSHCSATGGTANGGTPGAGSDGDVNLSGGYGGAGSSSTSGPGGSGGNSILGGGGGGGSLGARATGSSAAANTGAGGGGGGGEVSPGTFGGGGSGASGIVIVEEIF